MLESLTELVTSSPTTYAVIVGFVALDAIFPVVPGETLITTGGILAADGGLSLTLVIAAGVLGGALGDNASYWVGVKLGRRAVPKLFRGEKSRRRLSWARDQLELRGGVIILAARFVPGGRTATTFAAGTLAYPWRRFLVVDLLAVAIWSAYAASLGYFGGEAFEDSLWKPLVVAAAIATVLAAAGELFRRRTAGDRAGAPASRG